jgi:hypothetical protein
MGEVGEDREDIVDAGFGTTDAGPPLRSTPRSHRQRLATILSAVKPSPFLPLV